MGRRKTWASCQVYRVSTCIPAEGTVTTAPTHSVTCRGTFVVIVNTHLHIQTSTWQHAEEYSNEMQQPNWIQKYDIHDEAYKMLNLNLSFELYCWRNVVMCCCKGRRWRWYVPVHPLKVCRGSRCTASHILNLCNSWGWVTIYLTPSLYLQEGTLVCIE